MRLRYMCLFALSLHAVFGQTPSRKKTENPAQKPEQMADGSLPVRKIVLYKNGVGYFEHTGRVEGNQELGIDFTTAQLNDVLKSLTLVDLNGGQIAAVNYNSVAPLEEQLKGLQIPLSEDVTSAAFLIALRGTRVEVRGPAGTLSGKVFSVETVDKGGTEEKPIQVTQFTIVTDTGEMRLFELAPGIAVRCADPGMEKELERYLALMGSTRSREVRRMTIGATGTGKRKILVSYISEVPVWKSTYRIVLPKAPGKPFLQGWAIIDNTVGEDWKDVKLSLVSGTPQSFVQNISQPYYTRRPVLALPESVMPTPQTHETAWAAPPHKAMLRGTAGIPAGAGGGTVGGVLGSVVARGAGAGIGNVPAKEPEEETAEVSDLLSQEEAAAEGAAVGDFYEYNLKQQVTVLKNQSALVPIVQSPIEAEKVTLVVSGDGGEVERTPLRALWLNNTSGMTLDGGTFNVLEEDSFAGEGIMDLLHPGERRLISFAADKAIGVARGEAEGSKVVTRATVLKGVIAIHREERESNAYLLHNADSSARQVILEYPVRPGWKLAGDMKPEETSATRYRFRVVVAPGKTEKLSVRETRPVVARDHVSNMSERQLEIYLQEGAISAPLAGKLREVLAKKYEIFDVEEQIKSRQQGRDAIDKDQIRLRENMKALKGSPEEKALLERYTKQLNAEEDQLAALKNETEGLEVKKAELQAELDRMIAAINADETPAAKG